MPLYHTMGMHSLIAMLLVGGCYVCQPDWDAETALALIEHERITSLYLAPTLYHDLVLAPAVRRLRRLVGRDARVRRRGDDERARRALRGGLLPRLFVNHYGSTEIYTYSIHRDQAAKPGCAGRPALDARLRLGENGEILCHMSSDEAFAGYWNRPGRGREADSRRLVPHRRRRAAGRGRRPLARSAASTTWSSPAARTCTRWRSRTCSRAIPASREVAVVGAPDDRLGHRVVACVVAEGEVTAEELDALLPRLRDARALQAAARVPLRRRAAEEPVWEDPATDAA